MDETIVTKKLACNIISMDYTIVVIDTIRGGPPVEWKGGRVVCLLPVCLPAACCLSARGAGAKLIFVSVIVCLWGGGDY